MYACTYTCIANTDRYQMDVRQTGDPIQHFVTLAIGIWVGICIGLWIGLGTGIYFFGQALEFHSNGQSGRVGVQNGSNIGSCGCTCL